MVWLTWLFNCRRPQITNQLTNQQDELLQIKWTENRSAGFGAGSRRHFPEQMWSIDWKSISARVALEWNWRIPPATATATATASSAGQLIGIESPHLLPALCSLLSGCLSVQLSVKQMNKRKWQPTRGEAVAGSVAGQRFNCFLLSYKFEFEQISEKWNNGNEQNSHYNI